mmetsp:Transcript_6859/g.18972  ORF Transcript_6859/g.18972 Transcript_6859/m.18972 type:complete len:244 (+) Transcript_6859:296-1027(+)
MTSACAVAVGKDGGKAGPQQARPKASSPSRVAGDAVQGTSQHVLRCRREGADAEAWSVMHVPTPSAMNKKTPLNTPQLRAHHLHSIAKTGCISSVGGDSNHQGRRCLKHSVDLQVPAATSANPDLRASGLENPPHVAPTMAYYHWHQIEARKLHVQMNVSPQARRPSACSDAHSSFGTRRTRCDFWTHPARHSWMRPSIVEVRLRRFPTLSVGRARGDQRGILRQSRLELKLALPPSGQEVHV